MDKEKISYICNGLNNNCPEDCRVKAPHKYDNFLDEESRCGYPGSDRQFDLVKSVKIND